MPLKHYEHCCSTIQALASLGKIGGYEVLEQIGQGGMGTVYRAKAPDGSLAAIKTLHLHLCGIDEFVRRFHREAKLAAKLAHPNVVRWLEGMVVVREVVVPNRLVNLVVRPA